MTNTSKENNRRKKKAMNALGVYLRDDPSDFKACLTELLADLMHVARDDVFNDCLRIAREHVAAEKMGI